MVGESRMNPETNPFNLDISGELIVFVIVFVIFVMFLGKIQKFFRDGHKECDGECLHSNYLRSLTESGKKHLIKREYERLQTERKLTPTTFMDDGEWYAFYGNTIQHGSYGVGDTESKAINDLLEKQ